MGENLSPRAQILLNGTPSPANPDPCQAAGTEFLSELIVTPGSEKTEIALLKVRNPDGQIAEWRSAPPGENPSVKSS
jgi:hypothetical protein